MDCLSTFATWETITMLIVSIYSQNQNKTLEVSTTIIFRWIEGESYVSTWPSNAIESNIRKLISSTSCESCRHFTSNLEFECWFSLLLCIWSCLLGENSRENLTSATNDSKSLNSQSATRSTNLNESQPSYSKCKFSRFRCKTAKDSWINLISPIISVFVVVFSMEFYVHWLRCYLFNWIYRLAESEILLQPSDAIKF